MNVLDSVRTEWAKSRNLSRNQRLIAGILSVISIILFLNSSLYTPLLNLAACVPVSLFLLGITGGPVKKVLGVSLASGIGAVLGTLL